MKRIFLLAKNQVKEIRMLTPGLPRRICYGPSTIVGVVFVAKRHFLYCLKIIVEVFKLNQKRFPAFVISLRLENLFMVKVKPWKIAF